MMELGLSLLFCFLIYFKASPYLRANKVISKWAQDRNFSIEKKEVRFINSGPFFYQKNRAVFKVEFKNDKQVEKTAWVMIGHILCLNPEKIVVKWDSELKDSPHDGINFQSILLFIFYAASYLFLLLIIILFLIDFDIRGYLEAAVGRQ